MNYDTTVLADSPTHYWLLNEASGVRADSVGSNSLTPSGGVGIAASWITGDNAVTFDGTNGKLSLASGIATGTTCTIEFLFFPINGSAYGALFTQDDVKGFYFLSAGNNLLDWYDGATDHQSTSKLLLSQWAVHIAIVISAGSGTFYINGVPDGTFTGFAGFTANSIGTDPSSEAIKGRMSRLAFYTTALTPAKVAADFAALNMPAGNAVTALSPAPNAYYSSAGLVATDNTAANLLPEASGGTAATMFGATYHSTAGTNSTPSISILSGKISIPYAGAIGSIVTLMKTTGPIWTRMMLRTRRPVRDSARSPAATRVSQS